MAVNIKNKVAHLGFLNDELKRVVALTNEKNKELAVLNEALENARKEVSSLTDSYNSLRNANLREESRHIENIRKLEKDITALKQLKKDCLKELGQTIELTNSKRVALKEKLELLKEHLASFENKKTTQNSKLDNLNSRLALIYDEINQAQNRLDSYHELSNTIENRETSLREKEKSIEKVKNELYDDKEKVNKERNALAKREQEFFSKQHIYESISDKIRGEIQNLNKVRDELVIEQLSIKDSILKNEDDLSYLVDSKTKKIKELDEEINKSNLNLEELKSVKNYKEEYITGLKKEESLIADNLERYNKELATTKEKTQNISNLLENSKIQLERYKEKTDESVRAYKEMLEESKEDVAKSKEEVSAIISEKFNLENQVLSQKELFNKLNNLVKEYTQKAKEQEVKVNKLSSRYESFNRFLADKLLSVENISHKTEKDRQDFLDYRLKVKRDINVVIKRLKREWKHDKPFPVIYDERTSTRN